MVKKEIKDSMDIKKSDDVKEIPSSNLDSTNLDSTKLDEVVDDSPSWYHYVIIIAGMVLFFYGIAFMYNTFGPSDDISQFKSKLYNYEYELNNKTFNVKFNFPLDILEKTEFIVEPSKFEVLNTNSYQRSFYTYTGEDNGQVTKTAGLVRNFIKYVYDVDFAVNSTLVKDFSCKNSTLDNKVMIFDINSSREGVFYDGSNGCLSFETKSAENFLLLGNKFVYDMIFIK